MNDTASHRPISLIGLPYHFGARPRATGYQMARGPLVLLAEDAVPALLRESAIDATVKLIEADDPDERDYGDDIRLMPPGDQMIRQRVQASRLADAVRGAIAEDRFPFSAAGNCHTSIGVIAGIDDDSIGMIWFDAHADANTPDTSSNGMFEGMPVSVIAGQCWQRYVEPLNGFHVIPEDRIITVGDHEIYSTNGRGEDFGSGALGRVVSPPVIREQGFTSAMEAAVEDLATRTKRVHVHIDVDVIGNEYVWGNRHASDGGLSPEQLLEAIDIIQRHLTIAAVNVTAFDPEADPHSSEVLVPLIADVARRVTSV